MNRLLITVDSLRNDHFQYMQNTLDYMDSTHDRSFSTFTATLGAFQSIIGGGHPDSGHLDEGQSVARQLDCFSVGFTANRLLSESYGYADGFDVFHSPVDDGDSIQAQIAATIPFRSSLYRIAARAWSGIQRVASTFRETEKSFRPADSMIAQFLKEVRDEEEWFGWLHFMEPHHPYDPYGAPSRVQAQGISRTVIAGGGSEEAFRTVRELYRQEVEELDEKLAVLWDSIPEDTRVVFCADHGELLGENGLWGHPSELMPEILHVPFGTRNAPELGAVVSLIDVPSILLGEPFGRGSFDRNVAFASIGGKKAAMNREHIATEDRVLTFEGAPAEDPALQRALSRFRPSQVVKEDALREDLEKLGYI